jgi:hypothetical protein
VSVPPKGKRTNFEELNELYIWGNQRPSYYLLTLTSA